MKFQKTYKTNTNTNTNNKVNNKIYYVYKLVNYENKIEYIGETDNLKTRLSMHITSSKSKFLNRSDLQIIAIKQFDNKKDAFNYQCKLQKKYGFETDKEKHDKQKIPVICYDITGNYINTFSSLKHAADTLNLPVGNICRVLKKMSNRVGDYTFEYKK